MKAHSHKSIGVLVCTLMALGSYATTLTPSTFTIANLSNITDGTTVYLEEGVYKPSPEVLDAWADGVRNSYDITFEGQGLVVFDLMSLVKQYRVRFLRCENLTIKNITLKNLKLEFWHCTNSTFDNITSREQKFILPSGEHPDDFGKNSNLLGLGHGENCTISNCTLEVTFMDFPIKGIKSYRGINHRFINNTITGNLMGAYEIWQTVENETDGIAGYSGALVEGGYLERTVTSGKEDHGIYYHDVSDAMINCVTVKGWSPTAGGGAVKIKNANNVEIKNCTFYTSGILLRTGRSGWLHCSNVYIHDNDIYGEFAISTYMTPDVGYDHPEAIVFENNKLFDDGIKMKYDPAAFNQFCDRAGKNGGIYNNEYGGVLDLADGVNVASNCAVGDGCAQGADAQCGDLSTSIDDVPAHTIRVFPNPTNAYMTIQDESQSRPRYELYSLLGVKVKEGQMLGNTEEVNLAEFPPNFYFLKVGHQVVRIMKTN